MPVLYFRQGWVSAMRGGEVAVAVPPVALCTVLLPLTALSTCLLWATIADFEKATWTHCEVAQFAPSISAVVGGPGPWTHLWRAAVGLASTPSLLIACMYRSYYKERLPLARPALLTLNFVLNLTESLSLVGLTFVSSSDLFELHGIFFLLWGGSSLVSMSLVAFHLLPRCGFQARTAGERWSAGWKVALARAALVATALAAYFYWRHNELCEPYMYSMFALSEYSLVLCIIGQHALAAADLGHLTLAARLAGHGGSRGGAEPLLP